MQEAGKTRRIYLDHNATTPLHPEVLEAMLPWLGDGFGNASSIHTEGRKARAAMDRSRSLVAEFLIVDESEVYFTSGGTESNNLALHGVAESQAAAGKSHLITSSVEHPAVLRPMQHLAAQGRELTLLPVDGTGRVDPEELHRSILPDKTALVSIIAANNEVGTIQPIESLGNICRDQGVSFHVDGVQAAGRLPLNLGDLPVDLLSISAHKLYGPQGVGALYIRKGIEVEPRIFGGGHERGRRSGTENIAGIVGFGAACELAGRDAEKHRLKQQRLRDYLFRELFGRIEGARLNGHTTERLCNTLNVSFEGVEGEALLLNLDLKGVAVSSGSACSSGSLEPSHVLIAMGLTPEQAQNSVRFSLGRGNTEAEIDDVVEIMVEIVSRLRNL
jgi:cysteine desulfurase